jgi:excisionase family DNA binding protein
MADQPSPDTRPLTVSEGELARRMGVSKKTLYRWRCHEKLPHVRVGKIVLFRPSTVDRWLAAREVVGVAAVRGAR